MMAQCDSGSLLYLTMNNSLREKNVELVGWRRKKTTGGEEAGNDNEHACFCVYVQSPLNWLSMHS